MGLLGSLGHSWASLGPLLGLHWALWGSLGALLASSWAPLGLSWASLRLSWTLLGLFWASIVPSWPPLGPLLGSLGAPRGGPGGLSKRTLKKKPSVSWKHPFTHAFWDPILGPFFVIFWVPFLISFFDASWLLLGPQKWPKRLQDDTSKHLKVLKNHVFFRVFCTSPLSSL